MDEIVSALLDGITRLMILSLDILKMAVTYIIVLLCSAGFVVSDCPVLLCFKLLKHLLGGVGALTSVGWVSEIGLGFIDITVWVIVM